MNSQAKKLYPHDIASNQFAPVISAKRKNNKLDYFNLFMDIESYTTSVIEADVLMDDSFFTQPGTSNIIGEDSLNRVCSLNNYIKKANNVLPHAGLLAGNFKPKEARKEKLHQKYGSFLFYPIYFLDFLWHRVFSKLKFTRAIYEKSSNGPRVFAMAEVLGRIAAGGFEIVDYEYFGNKVYFVARKKDKPSFYKTKSHGLIFTMSRISKNKQVKDFYKLRTMHLYAEHLQNFVYKKNGLSNGDKFNDDFRVTSVGKFLRKYWLDELPMLYNWLRGDLKLVGVRPLSDQKFSLYSKELQDYRTNFKPGLVPPFYADMPESLKEVMDSEYRYLKAYEKAPLRTDFKYFFKAIYNILIKKARSN